MCGIAGIVGYDPETSSRIRQMIAAIAHRGPDDAGVYEDNGVALGHRRLSVIGLDAGPQPISNSDESLQLVFNGEIYNWKQLRRDLEKVGYRFETATDGEVILHLYDRHGEKCLQFLRGMFAFAIWDARRQTLFAARDHVGQKPLYYSDDANRLIFASEIKALTRIAPELREPSLPSVDQYLASRVICPPDSMFRDVRKLPPGHFLTKARGKAVRISRYWDLNVLPKWHGSEKQLVEELNQQITESLRLHMVSDVEVGALLSGGLDSSLIVAMLSKNLGIKELPTFTLGIPHPKFDEARHAREIARHLNTTHHETVLVPSIADELPAAIYHLDEPTDQLALCTWAVSRFARQHVKVVLGGDGGDELFGGYDRYYGIPFASHYARVPESLRKNVIGPLLERIPDGNWYKSASHRAKWIQHVAAFEADSRYSQALGYFYFTAEQRRRLFSPEVTNNVSGLLGRDPMSVYYAVNEGADMVDRMIYTDYQSRLPDHPVMVSDRTSMAFGLETRNPFLDHKLVEFCARLPVRMKVRGWKSRLIQRHLACRYLPSSALRRRKQGFASALPYLLKVQEAGVFSRLLRQSQIAKDGILVQARIDSVLKENTKSGRDWGNRVWLLANLEAWYRIHIKQTSVDDLRAELREPNIT